MISSFLSRNKVGKKPTLLSNLSAGNNNVSKEVDSIERVFSKVSPPTLEQQTRQVVTGLLAEEGRELKLDNSYLVRPKIERYLCLSREDLSWQNFKIGDHIRSLIQELNIKSENPYKDLFANHEMYVNEKFFRKNSEKIISGKSPDIMLTQILKDAELHQHSYANRLLGGFIHNLKKSDLLEEFKSKDYKRCFARALRDERVQSILSLPSN